MDEAHFLISTEVMCCIFAIIIRKLVRKEKRVRNCCSLSFFSIHTDLILSHCISCQLFPVLRCIIHLHFCEILFASVSEPVLLLYNQTVVNFHAIYCGVLKSPKGQCWVRYCLAYPPLLSAPHH